MKLYLNALTIILILMLSISTKKLKSNQYRETPGKCPHGFKCFEANYYWVETEKETAYSGWALYSFGMRGINISGEKAYNKTLTFVDDSVETIPFWDADNYDSCAS